MAVQWLGWEPPTSSRTQRSGGGRSSGGGDDFKKELYEKALADEAWERDYKDRVLKQSGELARSTEEGRGKRAAASEQRYYDSLQRKEFNDNWALSSPEDKAEMLATPGMREKLEEVAGVPLFADRYEKGVPEKPLSSKEFETRRDILEGRKPQISQTFKDYITPKATEAEQGRIDETTKIEERMRELEEKYLTQSTGTGTKRKSRAVETLDKQKYEVGQIVEGTGQFAGKKFRVIKIDAQGPGFEEVK